MTRRDDLEKTIKDLQKALHEAQEELDNLSKFERKNVTVSSTIYIAHVGNVFFIILI